MNPGELFWIKTDFGGDWGDGTMIVTRAGGATIPDAPNLQAVAKFLALHPETGAALKSLLAQSPLPDGHEGREQRRTLRGLAKAIGGGE